MEHSIVDEEIPFNERESFELLFLKKYAVFRSFRWKFLCKNFVYVLQVKISYDLRNERCRDLLCIKCLPVYAVEEYMSFDFINTSKT